MRIYEMESSKKGKFFLAAEFEKRVSAYESTTGRKLGEYSTHFQSGGKRMCIADSGKYFAAAAYSRFGITLFELVTGAELWTTKEVKRVQRICFSADETMLFAINEDNKLYTISLTDGSVISVENGIKKIFSNHPLDVKLTKNECLIWNEVSASLTDKKVLCLCFGNNKVFCTIMCGGIMCFSENGNELWYAENKFEEHYVKLCYCPKFDFIIGLGYKYGSSRTEPFYFADAYSAEKGNIIFSVGLSDDSVYTFIDNGESIVSGTGKVYTLSGNGYILNEKHFNM